MLSSDIGAVYCSRSPWHDQQCSASARFTSQGNGVPAGALAVLADVLPVFAGLLGEFAGVLAGVSSVLAVAGAPSVLAGLLAPESLFACASSPLAHLPGAQVSGAF